MAGDFFSKQISGSGKMHRRDLLQALLTGMICANLPDSARADTNTEVTHPHSLTAFPLAAVKLLDGPFATAQQLDAKYLLSLDADRLLHNFHVNAGLKSKAPVYGGWESQQPWVDIRCHGHTLGHYLSACAMMFASTGDEKFRKRVDYIVAELTNCQQASTGMVCAFPDGLTQLENSLNGKPFVGVPWYTTHKVMSGLRDACLFTSNQQALDVVRAMADWTIRSSADLDDAQFQHMLRVEHGGMNEVLADLYMLTSEKKYLQLAERFNHRALLDPLIAGQDTLDGLHSNTQIPKVIGFLRQSDLTGNEMYGRAAAFFWQNVAGHRSFATGGNGDGEHFFPVGDFSKHLPSAKTMETCCTHNMLRLTRALFLRAPDATYADYYERALFNDILASQDPDSGMMTYFQATRPGYLKLYCTPTDSFWCCTGTGMENHAKYADSIYFHDDSSLYVNLFIASEVNWSERNFRIRQETKFPEQPGSRFTVHVSRPTRMSVKIRHPAWCEQLTLTLNGRIHAANGKPGSYVEIDRIWRDGDVIDAVFVMRLHLEKLPGSTDIAALMYGPIVLAARLGTEGIEPGSDIIVNERTYGDVLSIPMELPQLSLNASVVNGKVRRVSNDKLVFRVSAQRPQHELELIPFYQIAHERYNLYWQLV